MKIDWRLGSCYKILGNPIQGETNFEESWTSTDTSGWSECQSTTETKSLCTSPSWGFEAALDDLPVLSWQTNTEAFEERAKTDELCKEGETESGYTQQISTTVEGIQGNVLHVCAAGLEYEVEGKRFLGFKNNTVQVCYREAQESGVFGCPGVQCQTRGLNPQPSKPANPKSKKVVGKLRLATKGKSL